MKSEQLIDELISERQWLYVAIERYPARLIGSIYPQLLDHWAVFQPESELILDNIWEISQTFIELFYGAVDSSTESAIDDFIARQIWLDKISKQSITGRNWVRILV
jgi:hypothetical protein